MKKTLLLSVVASTMIMAGGDIAPVEPVVVAEEVSAWDFSGQAVVYYQTTDAFNNGDLFDQDYSIADAGIKLSAVNKDVFWGIGAGVEMNGLATLNLENYLVSGVPQSVANVGGDINDITDGGWISQAYLTYGFGNTSIKAGRQTLPKALSPFAFSENWNVFANTFDSVLVVNTDISNTTLVYAFVYGNNFNAPGANMRDFNPLNDTDGVHMVTAQNQSIDGLTLTGSWYYGKDMTGIDDVNILWGDAKFALAGVSLGLQGGTVMGDFVAVNPNDTVAFGAKAGYDFGMFDASIAYTNVDDGDAGLFNVGGVKTPLYTQMILNQNFIRSNNDTFVARAGMEALGGKFSLAYDYTTDDSILNNDYTELDLVYTTKIASTNLFVGYIYQDMDIISDSSNTVRIWGRYNF